MNIKKILISQPKPTNPKNSFLEIAEKCDVQIDFEKFISIEGVSVTEFRKTKIDLLKFNIVIFTSKTAIDHYFRMAEGLNLKIPSTMKYYCINESIAYYIQKYIIYRKRKIAYSNGSIDELIEMLKKYQKEKVLLPVADIHKPTIPNKLKKNKFNVTKAVLYRTVSSDIKDLNINEYDIITFFSPAGITSLLENFPDYEQGKTKFAAFGTETSKAIKKANFKLQIKVPSKKHTSMATALIDYIKK